MLALFTLTSCQLQELNKLKAVKPKYVQELLHNLPATVNATCKRMLDGIEGPFYA